MAFQLISVYDENYTECVLTFKKNINTSYVTWDKYISLFGATLLFAEWETKFPNVWFGNVWFIFIFHNWDNVFVHGLLRLEFKVLLKSNDWFGRTMFWFGCIAIDEHAEVLFSGQTAKLGDGGLQIQNRKRKTINYNMKSHKSNV